MSDEEDFLNGNRKAIDRMGSDPQLRTLTNEWFRAAAEHEYSYHFSWMGRPIIQFPQDIVAMQELIWKIQPDLIIETGIARGGSLIFYASMLELLGGDRQVLGIDIDIRSHNRNAVEQHPMFNRIALLEGSSVAPEIVRQVESAADGKQCVMVVLDSNHTHDHVQQELACYADMVTPGSYLIVFDSIIEDMPESFSSDRPWGPGNNPKTAVHQFLAANRNFEIDREIQDKLQITVAPDGYLRRVQG